MPWSLRRVRLGIAVLMLTGSALPVAEAAPVPATNLAGLVEAHRLLDLWRQSRSDPLRTAVTLAKEGTAYQAATLGVTVRASTVPAHASPGAAAGALATRYGVAVDVDQLRGLDRLPEPVHGALTGVIDAFLGFADATGAAYAGSDLSAVTSLPESGVDLGPIFAARNGLLDAVVTLRDATRAVPGPYRSVASTLDLCPALALDLSGTSDRYETDCRLIVDLGGWDTYTNNAGGSGSGSCGATGPGGPGAAAAVIDFDGGDTYGHGDSPRFCGANGGGHAGAGFLLDIGGADDTYVAGDDGTNGGGHVGGVGFLLDVFGYDDYAAGSNGTNGGGHAGAGFLLHIEGGGAYSAGSNGANGGGSGGTGFLLDIGGPTTYDAGSNGTNGGGNFGTGRLYDFSGTGDRDTYTAGGLGTNGGGHFGAGLLYDNQGTDSYSDFDGGTGTDRTVVPKGTVGAQYDRTS